MLNPLYDAIARVILFFHGLLSPVFGTDSGAAWALAIVMLVVGIRLVLFPLFLKQLRAQHAMQKLQPEVTKLRKRYANDKQQLNQEMMRLYRENNANPLSGCLPLIIQGPIFYALYRVLDHIGTHSSPAYGFTTAQLHSIGSATIFGVPLSASFRNHHGASALSAHVTVGAFIAVAVVVTFLSQKLLMASRSQQTAELPDAQARMQKIMLYIAPLFILIGGFSFPLGVLLYWATSYTWTLLQTVYVVKNPVVPPKAKPATVAAGAATSALPPPGTPEEQPAGAPAESGATRAVVQRTASGAVRVQPRKAGSRSQRRKR